MGIVENFLKENYPKTFTQKDLVEKLPIVKSTVSKKIKALKKTNQIIITKLGRFNVIQWVPKMETQMETQPEMETQVETQPEMETQVETQTITPDQDQTFPNFPEELVETEIIPQDVFQTAPIPTLFETARKAAVEYNKQIDSLNLVKTNLHKDISIQQDIIKKQNFQIENHANELLDRDTTIENLIKSQTTKNDYRKMSREFESLRKFTAQPNFNSFMIHLEKSNSYASQHLKEKLLVKGKHKAINKERVIRIIRDVIDVVNE